MFPERHEAVFAGLDAVILTHGKGNGFGFHFLGIPVFRWLCGFVDLCGGKAGLFIVMQCGVGDFVDGGGNGLYLAHAGADGDTLVVSAEITVHA